VRAATAATETRATANGPPTRERLDDVTHQIVTETDPLSCRGTLQRAFARLLAQDEDDIQAIADVLHVRMARRRGEAPGRFEDLPATDQSRLERAAAFAWRSLHQGWRSCATDRVTDAFCDALVVQGIPVHKHADGSAKPREDQRRQFRTIVEGLLEHEGGFLAGVYFVLDREQAAIVRSTPEA